MWLPLSLHWLSPNLWLYTRWQLFMLCNMLFFSTLSFLEASHSFKSYQFAGALQRQWSNVYLTPKREGWDPIRNWVKLMKYPWHYSTPCPLSFCFTFCLLISMAIISLSSNVGERSLFSISGDISLSSAMSVSSLSSYHWYLFPSLIACKRYCTYRCFTTGWVWLSDG